MTGEQRLKLMQLIRQAEDEMIAAQKAIAVFDDDKSWHKSHDDPTRGTIDKFDHLGLDPRIIANRGLRALDIVSGLLSEAWYELKGMDPKRPAALTGADET